jgi:hypothetical protein
LTKAKPHGIINTTKAKEITTMTKKQHFKKVEKKNQQKAHRDVSVACKNYKQAKRTNKEAYEEWG